MALVVALALGFACAGFLPFNLRPGRAAAVFMGDSGSQVLGFALAALALSSSWKVAGTTLTTTVLPLLVLAIPILDTALVTVRRLLEGRPVTQGGRDHASHRLVYYGLSERKAVGAAGRGRNRRRPAAVAYNILNNPRVTILGVLVTFVLLVQFASALTDLGGAHHAWVPGPPRTCRYGASSSSLGRLVEWSCDFASIAASFLAAYLLFVRGLRDGLLNGLFFLAALPILLADSLSVLRRVRRLPPDLAFRGVATVLHSLRRRSSPDSFALGILRLTWETATSRPKSSLSTPSSVLLLVGSSRLVLRALPSSATRGEQRRSCVACAGGSGRSPRAS